MNQFIHTVNKSLIGCEIEIYTGASNMDKGKVIHVDGKMVTILSDLYAFREMTYDSSYYWMFINKDVVNEPPPIPKNCDCAAKHTSFPNHHLKWCSLKSV
jgi:hypothetical protein